MGADNILDSGQYMSQSEFKTPRKATLILADTFDTLAVDLRSAAAGDFSRIRSTAELHYWSMALRTVPILTGYGVGHPTVRPGETFTSQLFFIDEDAGWARTMSRWYRLGPRADRETAPSFEAH